MVTTYHHAPKLYASFTKDKKDELNDLKNKFLDWIKSETFKDDNPTFLTTLLQLPHAESDMDLFLLQEQARELFAVVIKDKTEFLSLYYKAISASQEMSGSVIGKSVAQGLEFLINQCQKESYFSNLRDKIHHKEKYLLSKGIDVRNPKTWHVQFSPYYMRERENIGKEILTFRTQFALGWRKVAQLKMKALDMQLLMLYFEAKLAETQLDYDDKKLLEDIRYGLGFNTLEDYFPKGTSPKELRMELGLSSCIIDGLIDEQQRVKILIDKLSRFSLKYAKIDIKQEEEMLKNDESASIKSPIVGKMFYRRIQHKNNRRMNQKP